MSERHSGPESQTLRATDQLTVGALVHEGEQTTAIKGGQKTVFAGVTMRQENVLCFEYGLLGNVDRGCDFHRIKALQWWRHECHKCNE